MDTHKINIKFYLENGRDIAPETWYRTFNTWIPEARNEVLIDVVDYSHVHEGPVTLLVGHGANYSIDNTGGRPGLLYHRKQPLPGNLSDRLRTALRAALDACRRLEEDPSLEGKPKFRGDEIRIVLNDRLAAPDTDATLSALRPHLKGPLSALYNGARFTVSRDPDSGRRLSLNVAADGTWDTPTLRKNMEMHS